MLNLSQIESDLKDSLKARDGLRADTLRGLKARIQSQQTAAAGAKELNEAEIIALVRSEVKRRKEAAESFAKGGRPELAEKELAEAKLLEVYLPAQMPEEELVKIINQATEGATAADFGKIMGKLKAQVGDKADGATLARILKEKLK